MTEKVTVGRGVATGVPAAQASQYIIRFIQGVFLALTALFGRSTQARKSSNVTMWFAFGGEM